jgi:hypothetical protein
MDNAILVKEKIEKGKDLIDELIKEHYRIYDALWVNDEGYWKLIISSPYVNSEGPLKLYKVLDRIIRKKELINYIQPDKISVIDPQDNLIKMLRAANTVRNKIFTDAPLEDTYIYFLKQD